MAIITTTRDTENIGAQQRYEEMDAAVSLLQPDEGPLTTITGRIGSVAAGDPEISWNEDDLLSYSDAVNNGAGYTDSATSVVVDTGTKFGADDLVKVPRTGEVMLVSSVSTNTLTVVRGKGGGAAALVDNDPLLVIGGAQPENADPRDPKSENPVKVTNYLQISRTSWAASNTARFSRNKTKPHDWKLQVKKKTIEHKRALELTGLFGKPSENTSGEVRRTTGGVLHFSTENITDAGGALTEAELFAWLRDLFAWGDKQQKLGLASALVIDVINAFGRGKLELVQADSDKTYGLAITKIVSPHGVLNLTEHRLLTGTEYGGYMVGVDMSNIRRRHLANEEGSRNTHLIPNVQVAGRDGRQDELLTEAGWEVRHPKTHGVLKNVTS